MEHFKYPPVTKMEKIDKELDEDIRRIIKELITYMDRIRRRDDYDGLSEDKKIARSLAFDHRSGKIIEYIAKHACKLNKECIKL